MNTYQTRQRQNLPTDSCIIDDEFDFLDLKNGIDDVLNKTVTAIYNAQLTDTRITNQTDGGSHEKV